MQRGTERRADGGCSAADGHPPATPRDRVDPDPVGCEPGTYGLDVGLRGAELRDLLGGVSQAW
jgi:hypothetical protein